MSTDRGRELHDTLRAEVSRTGFGSTEVLQVITTALATVRRETWEAASGIVDAAGKEWGDCARKDKSKTYSAYAIAALDLKGRLEVAALESAKEKDEQH